MFLFKAHQFLRTALLWRLQFVAICDGESQALVFLGMALFAPDVSQADREQQQPVEPFDERGADVGLVHEQCPEKVTDEEPDRDDHGVAKVEIATAVVDGGPEQADGQDLGRDRGSCGQFLL